jgi:hypothetical protein
VDGRIIKPSRAATIMNNLMARINYLVDLTTRDKIPEMIVRDTMIEHQTGNTCMSGKRKKIHAESDKVWDI